VLAATRTTTALFFFAAFVLVPVAMVAARGGGNLHSRIQRYHALRVSVQSDDPGHLAIADAGAELEILEGLLVPSRGRRMRARALYDSWRKQSEWEIYELADQRVEIAEGGESATARYALKASRERDRLHFACEDVWTKHEGVWYLDRRQETRLGGRRTPPPAPVLPD
jgi:hypothetical protein